MEAQPSTVGLEPVVGGGGGGVGWGGEADSQRKRIGAGWKF